MKLTRLKLENFRQLAYATVEFSDGMTAIVGANGSGKTTILESISFALFGDIRANRDDLRFIWSGSKKYSAILEFDFDGKSFEVRRSNDQASLIELRSGGQLEIAIGMRETTKACSNLLRLNSKQFKNSFCAEQKNLAFLNFSGKPDERRAEIGRMLGFDRLRQASTTAADRRRIEKAKADELERTIGIAAPYEAAIAEAKAQLQAVEGDKVSTTAELASAKAQFAIREDTATKAARYRQISDQLIGLRTGADAMKQSMAEAERATAEAERRALRRRELEPEVQAFETAERRLQEFERQRQVDQVRILKDGHLKRIAKEIEALEREILALKAQGVEAVAMDLDAARLEVARWEAELKKLASDWQASRDSAKAAFASSEAAERQARTRLAHIEKLVATGKCPECEREFETTGTRLVDDARTIARDAANEVEAARQAVAAAETQPPALVEAERRLTEARRSVDQAASASQASVSLSLKARSLEEKGTEKKSIEDFLSSTPAVFNPELHAATQKIREEKTAAHREYLQLADADARLTAAKAAEVKARTTYEEARAEFRALQDERTGLGFDDLAAAATAIQARDELSRQIAGLEQRSYASSELARNARAALAKAEADMARHRQREAELKAYRTQEALLDQTAKQMKSLLDDLNRGIRPQLVARASENLNLLTNGRYHTLELSEGYEPSLIDGGERKTVISGGEEDVVALSLRLALSELIQERQGRPMSLLILDEVFASLDADRRQSVLDRLIALKDRFSQILVISHIEEINQVADQCLYLRRDVATRATIVSDAPPDLGLAM